MKRYYADRTCLNIMRLMILIITFILLILSAYFLSFIPIIMFICSSIFFAAGFFFSAVYLPVYFRNMHYDVSKEKIIKTSGFFFIKKQIIRLDAIQFTTSFMTPFSKLTGLNFIILNAFGGNMSVIFLSKKDFDDMNIAFRN